MKRLCVDLLSHHGRFRLQLGSLSLPTPCPLVKAVLGKVYTFSRDPRLCQLHFADNTAAISRHF
jgi:hypothetical protein